MIKSTIHGIGFGMLLLLPLAYLLNDFLRAAAAMAIVGGLCFANRQAVGQWINGGFEFRSPLSRWMAAVCVGLMLLRGVESLFEYRQLGLPGVGLAQLFWTLIYIAVAAILVARFRWEASTGVALEFAIAFGFYCGVNTLLYEVGVQNANPEIAGVSLDNPFLARMLPPFAKSTTNFGAYAVLGGAFSMVAALHPFPRKVGDLFRLVLGAFSFLVCTYAAWQSQVRFGLLAYAFTLLWLAAWKASARKFLCAASLAGMIVLPFLYIDLAGVEILDKYLPGFLHDYLSRRSGELIYLGGRAMVYDYGFDLLAANQVGWLGMGTVFRDARPGIALWSESYAQEGASVSFHNGFLEILIAHGPIVCALFFAVLLLAVARLVFHRSDREAAATRDSRGRDWRLIGTFVIGVVSTIGAFEVVYNEIYGLLLILVATVGALEAGVAQPAKRPRPARTAVPITVPNRSPAPS
ncbi:MAG: hypothetical protein AB7O66_26040 [Limisphaerales bacterium]